MLRVPRNRSITSPNRGENGRFSQRSFSNARGGGRLKTRLRQDPRGRLLIIRMKRPSSLWRRLEFGPDGFFYIGIADSGPAGDRKDTRPIRTLPRKKMLRIDVIIATAANVMGRSPRDNPFVGPRDFLPKKSGRMGCASRGGSVFDPRERTISGVGDRGAGPLRGGGPRSPRRKLWVERL